MARKPRGLSDETLQRVVALREAGSSWIKIQDDVHIDRRTAKRAYEDWQRGKSIEELKVVRRTVAEEEFRIHLHYLVALAGALAQTLGVPSELSVVNPATDFLNKMWETNRLRNYSVYGVTDVGTSLEDRNLLFASLKTHTVAKVRWDALDEWERAWDECNSALEGLKQEVSGVVHNVLEQNNLLAKTKSQSTKDDVEQHLVRGVIHAVWEQILHPVEAEKLSIVEVEHLNNGRSQILFGKDRFVAGVIIDAELCEQVENTANRAAKSALLSLNVENIKRHIKIIRERVVELRESLNSLLLGPLIMSTRCDLCPA